MMEKHMTMGSQAMDPTCVLVGGTGVSLQQDYVSGVLPSTTNGLCWEQASVSINPSTA